MINKRNGLVHECLSEGDDDGWMAGEKVEGREGAPECSKFN